MRMSQATWVITPVKPIYQLANPSLIRLLRRTVGNGRSSDASEQRLWDRKIHLEENAGQQEPKMYVVELTRVL